MTDSRNVVQHKAHPVHEYRADRIVLPASGTPRIIIEAVNDPTKSIEDQDALITFFNQDGKEVASIGGVGMSAWASFSDQSCGANLSSAGLVAWKEEKGGCDKEHWFTPNQEQVLPDPALSIRVTLTIDHYARDVRIAWAIRLELSGKSHLLATSITECPPEQLAAWVSQGDSWPQVHAKAFIHGATPEIVNAHGLVNAALILKAAEAAPVEIMEEEVGTVSGS